MWVMMAKTRRALLSTGTSGAAIFFSLVQVSPALAACTTVGSTVTCPDPATPAGDVTAAVNTAATSQPDIVLTFPAGSSVVDDGSGQISAIADNSIAVHIDAGSTIGTDVDAAAVGASASNGVVTVDGTSGTGVTRTVTLTETVPSDGHAASADIGGIVTGQFSISSPMGPTSIVLSGQALSGISALSGATSQLNQTVNSFAGPDLLTLTPTGKQVNDQYTVIGGVASLAIQSSAAMIAAGTAAVDEGEIKVRGSGGATLTIGAGSRVFPDATIGGSIYLDTYFYNHTLVASEDYAGTGTAHSVQTEIATGGPSSFTNAGLVGTASATIPSGYYDAPTVVDVDSVTQSTLTNTGTIYGDAHLWTVGGTFTEVLDSTNINIPASRIDVATRYYTSSGGVGTFTNSGLIGGNVSLTAGTGTASNSGVIRGGVQFGASVGNFTVQATQLASAGYSPETIVSLIAPFTQSYTLNQTGLLVGAADGIAISVTGAVEDSGRALAPSIAPAPGQPLLTNSVAAAIHLQSGSVTLGDIVAEQNAATGARYTGTVVTLDGSGALGLSGSDAFRLAQSKAALAPFAQSDPLLSGAALLTALTTASPFTVGSRITGVDSVTKTGTGTFIITGGSYLPASGGGNPSWTVDAGSFAVQGGEVQLDVAPYTRTAGTTSYATVTNPVFGIRGSVTNAANMVIGRRIDGALPSIDGIALYVNGNFTQTATGTLVFGTMLGSTGTGTGTGSSASFVTLDGNLSLGGAVNLVTGRPFSFTPNISTDLFSVSGAVDISASTLLNGANSPFLNFTFAERSVGGRTIVSVEAQRHSYTTNAADLNSQAVGKVLDGQLLQVVNFLNDPADLSGLASAPLAQDLALVLTTLDTQVDAAAANNAMQQLSSGEFYGSLLATRTTDAFGDLTRGASHVRPVGDVNIWFNSTGESLRNGRNVLYGASATKTRNYGGSAGIGGSISDATSFGLGLGYGDIDQDARGTPENADAATYMVGGFANTHVAGFDAGVQLVYGWSRWDASRALPTFTRTATARFDSQELRVLGEVSHAFTFNALTLAPFVRGDLRAYRFEGFTEKGAGAIGLIVDGKRKTLFSPEIGARAIAHYTVGAATLSPELSASYTRQGDVGGSRDMAFIVDPTTRFRLRGSDPGDFVTVGGGVSAAFGRKSSGYVHGSYITGGDQSGVALSLGVSIGL
ncbi:hypothetical protein BH10PSE12_BH10PSE12_29440 [soil metagenome]